jgi:hypothetical protein
MLAFMYFSFKNISATRQPDPMTVCQSTRSIRTSTKHEAGHPKHAIIMLCCLLGWFAAEAQVARKVRFSAVSLGMDLPESYKNRTFIKGLSGFANNIDQLVGSMVLIEDNKTTVLTRFVRQDKPPVIATSTSDVIFSAKVDNRFRFNGAYSIASNKIEKDQINEIIITDVAVAFLKEDYIPYIEICKASFNVAPAVRQRTFYVRSAKLTTVYTRTFQKIKDDMNVTGMCFSAGGEIFSSSDLFKVDYIVSVDLVSLEKLLSLQNCEQLISSDELARRERAEQARLDAARTAEERRTRENDLAAAKAQVEELRRLLGQSVEQNAGLQRELGQAQEKERSAKAALDEAKNIADASARRATDEQTNVENKERIILTFKNKDGKVLEINSLEQLSREKLQELGFDVEVLRVQKF